MAIGSSVTKVMRSFYQNVSAEPAIFIYAFVISLYSAAIPNFIQQKVCSPETQPSVDFICKNTTLLAEATDVVTVRATLKHTLPTIILLLAGSWRDSRGFNKPILYFALFWEIVGVCIQMYACLNWTSSSWITSIIEGIINGFGGGNTLFFVGTTYAVTDSTNVEDRTNRLSIVSAAISIGATLGYGLFGYFLTYMGYTWFLILTISLYITAGILVMIFVKDKKDRKKNMDMCTSLKQLKSAFKRRPNIIVTWLMVFASSLNTVLILAELNVYQYFLQQAFDYSIQEAGLYTSYRSMVRSVGCITLSSILTKVMKWSDFKIGIVSSIITLISCISMVFSKTTWEIILFALLDALKGILFGLPKSIISKCVNEDEKGMFLSFCYIGECLLPLVIYYVYDCIYTATFTTLPGAFYLASAGIVMFLLIFYSISACIYTPLETFDEATIIVPEDLKNVEKVSQLPEASITKID